MNSTPLPDPASQAGLLRPGCRLDRYELLALVAEGGMASVWVARLLGKHGFEKFVAIKTILPKYAQDSHFRQMFLDEAHIAAGIEHTNVARILDLGEENGTLYIVMEWVDGDSINKTQRLLEQKNVFLPFGIVLRVMADACAGLHAAHELRGRDGFLLHVVHRDVSPQNILVSRDGAAKVIDFGIAKALDRISDDTGSGTLKGKVQYMAPEQAMGKPIDRRADVWSMGAVLYTFFSGKSVYEGEGQLAILQRLTSGKPPAPLPEAVPPPIARVIDGALRFNPDERWPTAAEVQRQIEKAMVLVGCQTTSSEVAAFIAEQLPERSVKRRETIERSILAAGDPITIPPPANQSAVRTRNATTVVAPAGTVTPRPLDEVRAGGEPEAPKPSDDAPQIPMSRPRLGVVLAVVGIAALIGAAAVRGLHRGGGAHPVAATPSADLAEVPRFRIPPPPPSLSPPEPDPAATLQTIPVEALPVATAPTTRQATRGGQTPPPPPVASPAVPPKTAVSTSKKKVVDDGF